MANLIYGKSIAEEINAATKRRILKLKNRGIVPKLAVVFVGKSDASRVYVGRKEKLARELGVEFALHHFPATIKQDELIAEIKKIQTDPSLSGLIVQLPLPERLYRREVLNAIRPEFDVDFLTDFNLGQLAIGVNREEPPTAGAVLDILRHLKINLVGKNVTIVGSGFLVGGPVSLLMTNERATVTVCNSATVNLKEKTLFADVVVSCVGKKDLIHGDMIRPGAVVIDAGFSFEDGNVYGDVNVPEVSAVADVTPTPGGLGPITVANLLKNIVIFAEKKLKK